MTALNFKHLGYYVVTVVLLLIAADVPRSRFVAQSTIASKQNQIDQLLSEGISALERNELPIARKNFEQVLLLDPKQVLAHTYLGLIADKSGNLNDAERHFAIAAQLDPSAPATRNNLGAVLLKLGKPQPAAVQFEASLRLNQNQPNALVNLAQIRFASGTAKDLLEANDLFVRAYTLAPDVEIARALVVIALQRGDQTTAAKYFAEYQAGAQAQPTAQRAELGGALLQAGMFREATVELNAAVTAEPANVESILRLANAYLGLKDIPAAGRTLESAVSRGVETAAIYALLASVYEQSGHVENAIPAMRLAIERDPQSERYRFSYGLLLTNAFAPDAAVIRLKEALELFPNSARLWVAMGIAHFKAGRNAEARTALTHAIELDPKFAPSFAYLGMTSVEIGDYNQAIKSYEQALAVDAKLGVVHYLIADVMLKQSNADANSQTIETHLSRATELEPNFAPARLALGKLYLRTNRAADAVGQLEQAIKLDANLAEAYYQIGRAYTKLKRTADAQNVLATFKRLSDSQKEQELKDRKDIVRRLADVRF